MEGKYMNPILAAICSFIIPGLGQALEGNIQKGVILFVVAFVIILISMFLFKSWLVNVISLIIALYAAYDAYVLSSAK